MRTSLIAVLPFLLLLASCTDAPTPYRDTNGKVAHFRQVGGKWMLTINADGSMALTGDNEISWQHTMQAATTLGMGLLDYLRTKVMELTTQLANANLTSIQRAQISADLAKYQSQLAAVSGLKSEGIKAGAPLGPINFQ